jgi:hypothetical protein
MKPTHHHDTKAYHDYYIHQAGKGYPVFAGGPTVSIAFWNKFCPIDFNRASAACLIFLPCTTSPAIFNPVFKASRPPIQYCPLLQRRFQTVEIDIRNDTGSIVPFERGRVVVTLHYTRTENLILS